MLQASSDAPLPLQSGLGGCRSSQPTLPLAVPQSGMVTSLDASGVSVREYAPPDPQAVCLLVFSQSVSAVGNVTGMKSQGSVEAQMPLMDPATAVAVADAVKPLMPAMCAKNVEKFVDPVT